jgi:thiol-disulfide isomerase/thioredoxin
MNIKKILLLSILILSIFIGCEKEDDINEDILAPSKDVKMQLPIFKLTSTTGEEIIIRVTKKSWIFENYKDKVVLLNFFATWCPPCKIEIPHLNKLQKKYGKDFQVLSILVEQDKPNSYVNKFIKEYKIQYPVTNSKVNFQLSSAVGGVRSIPTMFLFNKDGIVVQNYKGLIAMEILESDIKKIIGQ